jgi:hypothetical protein
VEIKTMRPIWQAGIVATAVALVCASTVAGGQAAPLKHRRAHVMHEGVAFAPGTLRSSHGRGHHYADLVGDPDSGYGFYPLPPAIRAAAWRYKVTHRVPPWQDPLYVAVASTAAGYHSYGPGSFSNAHSMFDPIDGVGTPFFAGYYGPASDDDDRPFPFGRPYPPLR